MITVQRTLRTDRPVDVVYAYLSDFTNAPEWDAGTVTCSLVDGDGGVGTRYLNTSRFIGRESDLTYVVTDLVRDARVVLEGRNDTVTSVDTMTMAASGSGTELVYRADFTFHGAARFLEPVLRIPLRRLGDDAERSLTDALSRL